MPAGLLKATAMGTIKGDRDCKSSYRLSIRPFHPLGKIFAIGFPHPFFGQLRLDKIKVTPGETGRIFPIWD